MFAKTVATDIIIVLFIGTLSILALILDNSGARRCMVN
jgi:hypothetical protein